MNWLAAVKREYTPANEYKFGFNFIYGQNLAYVKGRNTSSSNSWVNSFNGFIPIGQKSNRFYENCFKIKKSKIPNAGNGLFYTGAYPIPNGIILPLKYNFNEIYEKLSIGDVNERYGVSSRALAPFTWSLQKSKLFIDTLICRNYYHYFNDNINGINNIRKNKTDKEIKFVTSSIINKGDELYVSYGKEYWKNKSSRSSSSTAHKRKKRRKN